MVRYYGFYSNVARGKRKKNDHDELIPSILEPVEDPDFSGDGTPKEYSKNWARLIQKIYEVDPLTCPKCQGRMRILAFIEDEEVTRLPCLSMTCNVYELWEMKRGINLVIGCQGQWRAGKKDPQTS